MTHEMSEVRVKEEMALDATQIGTFSDETASDYSILKLTILSLHSLARPSNIHLNQGH
ncbi:predicted protein [Sclerotinia sclerotiorum 1980 UF-70]|uniref:Uncharacterized protein n=1 Tax=Sclerotinia sclerotiorum (strain ATCC 18683 / 1980 / Ss-1) TaxID=665079 RepID=A7ESQ2_SCLS1|nr:predicted protein [Sclerotinia sclerotiorum 1980 UF-70]EDN92494.1 predicted protein [Sclerotinia sclerotiorum 1980 UF-70]